MIGFNREDVHFLTIGNLSEGRKNVRGVVDAFTAVGSDIPHAKLLIKVDPDESSDWPRNNKIVFLPISLSDEYVNALYKLCDVYVSAHRCESWGLCMSDAIMADKPVIATGYSGNMEFVDENTAYPVRYSRARVQPGENGPGVDCGVWWASPDLNHLAERLTEVYTHFNDVQVKVRLANAKAKIRQFNRDLACQLIRERLSAIEGRFGGWVDPTGRA